MISGPKKQSICMRINISQYAHTSWKTREGFTRGLIESIAQTPDGYLWLGTQLELLRFDGVRRSVAATQRTATSERGHPAASRRSRWHTLDRHQ
jgi:ligand-binding sensor domain-containing protein